MANVKVKLVIRVKKPEGGWTRYPAWRAKNGRVLAGKAKVNGQPVEFKTYTYQLRSFAGRKAVYETVGTDPTIASNRFDDKQKARTLVRASVGVAGVTVTEQTSRQHFADAAKEYVQRTIDSGYTNAAANIYRKCFEMFQEAAPEVQYLDQINEKVMLKFQRYLREERGNSDASVNNRHRQITTLLIWSGVADGNSRALRKLLGKAPKFDKTLPDVYHRDELSTLFATVEDPATCLFLQRRASREGSNEYFYAVLRILQMTGIRQAEAAHFMWTDIDYRKNEIKVQAKPHLGFKLKDREERRIPIPPELLPVLEARRKVVPATHRLVVGRLDDRPHHHWIVILKRLAGLAGLNCGHCEMCMSDGAKYSDGVPVDGCEHWTLHGFRRTYATALDEAGFSLRQIMALLGHADIQTTMRYLGNRRTNAMVGVNW